MATCKDCLHFEVCEALEQGNGLMKVPPIHCGCYKNAADVVPRAEVESIFAEIEKKVKESTTIHLEELNKDYIVDTPLYDRHSGILFALQRMDDFLAELKKKYIGDKR